MKISRKSSAADLQMHCMRQLIVCTTTGLDAAMLVSECFACSTKKLRQNILRSSMRYASQHHIPMLMHGERQNTRGKC